MTMLTDLSNMLSIETREGARLDVAAAGDELTLQTEDRAGAAAVVLRPEGVKTLARVLVAWLAEREAEAATYFHRPYGAANRGD